MKYQSIQEAIDKGKGEVNIRGWVYRERGSNKFKFIVLRDSTNINPIASLANIFRKNKEYGSAIHYYQIALSLDPENFYYYKNLAYCYDRIEMPDGAVYAYQAAIMFNPYDVLLYVQLAPYQIDHMGKIVFNSR